MLPYKLQIVLRYIDEKLEERVDVRELASQVHMSPFHFARRFKRAVGLPPHAYITELRMVRARNLLSGTELPLVEVATRVGYRTQAHFTGVFRKHVGTTPRAYRVNSKQVRPGEGIALEQAMPQQAVRDPAGAVAPA
jgi:AraC family transcriptional regulator